MNHRYRRGGGCRYVRNQAPLTCFLFLFAHSFCFSGFVAIKATAAAASCVDDDGR